MREEDVLGGGKERTCEDLQASFHCLHSTQIEERWEGGDG